MGGRVKTPPSPLKKMTWFGNRVNFFLCFLLFFISQGEMLARGLTYDTNTPTHKHIYIATYRLNQPRCWCIENLLFQNIQSIKNLETNNILQVTYCKKMIHASSIYIFLFFLEFVFNMKSFAFSWPTIILLAMPLLLISW